MAKLSIKKDDFVMVIAGKDKGKTAHVLAVDIKKNRAVIEGKNITEKKKAVKSRKASDKSGIISMPSSINVSNIMPICASCDKPTRVGHIVVDGKKERKCIKCGAVLETKKVAEKKVKTTVKKKVKVEETATVEGTKATEVVATESTEILEEAPKAKATATKKTATATKKTTATATATVKKKEPAAKAESKEDTE